jgi:formylglycine-generating enzyme required for sulfatase activity
MRNTRSGIGIFKFKTLIKKQIKPMKKNIFSIVAVLLFATMTMAQHENIKFKVNGQTFEMVYVGPGTFIMGATPEQGIDLWLNERPTHRVTLSPYFIGKYEVTQALYEAVMGNNPSRFQGASLPVENVTWIEAEKFVETLNELLHEELGNKKFALPSEAQWEYAARGGNESEHYKYSGSDVANDVSWFSENSSDKTHTVGMLKPNELGICDMSGNVNEWCYDWWGIYNSEHRRNPNVTTEGIEHRRLVRGGGWDRSERYSRVSIRHNMQPERKSPSIGFRIVLVDDHDPVFWKNE